MSILIKGIKMPKCCADCPCFYDFISCQALSDGTDDFSMSGFDEFKERLPNCPLVEVPSHGRLIDADKLHKAMYHRAFETDGDTMWQSGCWVRYRAIEQVQDSQPTIIEADEVAS